MTELNIKDIMETADKYEWLPTKTYSRVDAFGRREIAIKASETMKTDLDKHLNSFPKEAREAWNVVALALEKVAAIELQIIQYGD